MERRAADAGREYQQEPERGGPVRRQSLGTRAAPRWHLRVRNCVQESTSPMATLATSDGMDHRTLTTWKAKRQVHTPIGPAVGELTRRCHLGGTPARIATDPPNSGIRQDTTSSRLCDAALIGCIRAGGASARACRSAPSKRDRTRQSGFRCARPHPPASRPSGVGKTSPAPTTARIPAPTARAAAPAVALGPSPTSAEMAPRECSAPADPKMRKRAPARSGSSPGSRPVRSTVADKRTSPPSASDGVRGLTRPEAVWRCSRGPTPLVRKPHSEWAPPRKKRSQMVTPGGGSSGCGGGRWLAAATAPGRREGSGEERRAGVG
eukprot:scaffold9782_cov225-Isochrysis_galbana.AAC.2